MALTLIAAMLVGLAAPFIRGWVWGVPFGLLSIATVLRSFISAALTTIIIGVVAFFALRATSMDQVDINRFAGPLAGAVALLLLLNSARRMREVRGLSVLCQRLREDDARSIAAPALGRLLDAARLRDERKYAALVLMATGPLTQAGMWMEARDRLRSLDRNALSEPQTVLCSQALATCELQFDDVDAAHEAIAQIRRPTESDIEVWLIAMEALLMAVRGQPAAALTHLGRQDAEDNPSLRASHRLVHAHVLAAQGNSDKALEELESLREEAGRAGLERAMLPRGPASPLAKQLLESTDQSG
jgi:tetratricopeptide (TPR) repeat protein